MAAIGFLIRLIALLVMYLISNPKILTLISLDQAVTPSMRKFNQRAFEKEAVVEENTKKA